MKGSTDIKIRGVLRTVDGLGRFVIPKTIRKSMSLEPGDRIDVRMIGSVVVLSKYEDSCCVCDSERGLKRYKDKYFCTSCLRDLCVLG